MTVTLIERERGVVRPSPGVRPETPAVGTFYTLDAGNDVAWRTLMPASALGAKVRIIPEKWAKAIFTAPNRGSLLPWTMVATTETGEVIPITSRKMYRRLGGMKFANLWAEFPSHEGTAILTRPDPMRAGLGLWMQQQGIRVVAECDDNYLSPAANAHFLKEQRWTNVHRLQHARSICTADALVFSTKALLDIYWKDLRKMLGKQWIPDMHVARNCVPRDQWPAPVERDGPLRVGFMGSSSHVWDINLAYRAFHTAKQEGCETVVIGYSPADPDPGAKDSDGERVFRSEKSQKAVDQWKLVIDRHVGWVKSIDYHRNALPLDIGFCPLFTNRFTLGKSDAKALELTISGAAVICTNNPVYNAEGWVHEQTCLMASSPDEFAAQTKRLIRDPKLRYELVSNAQEYVWNHRNEDVLVREWSEAL